MTSGLRRLVLALLVTAVAAPAAGQIPRRKVAQLPACVNGAPQVFLVVDADDASDCTSGGSSSEALCCCLDGTWAACDAGGGAGSIVVEEADGTPSVDPTTTLQLGTGFTVTDEGGGQAQVDLDLAPLPASLDYPPASPGTYDDEFNDISAWSFAGTATTPTSGDIDPLANVTTTPIYNVNDQWPGQYCVQSDDPSGETIILRRSYSPATNETFFFKLASQFRAFSTAGEGSFHLLLTNSGDVNEAIFIGMTHTSGGTQTEFGVNNNGTPTSRLGTNVAFFPFSATYFLLYKTGDVYNGWAFGEGGASASMGVFVTKTGVTAFDQLDLRLVTANETPSTFACVDFLRYYDSNTFALMNVIEVPGGGGGGSSLVVEEADGSPSESATDLIQWGDGLVQTDEGTGDVEIDVFLAGDVDGAGNATDLDEAAVESELEGVLDLPDLQGVLTVAKGGTGAAPAGDDEVLVSSSSSAAAWVTIPDSEAAGVILGYDQATNAWSTKTDDDVPEVGDFGALAATAPITQAGGTISTSIATGRLVGRTTGGAGVMEEITPDATLALAAGALGVVDVTCTGCLGSTEIAALDAGDTTTGTFDHGSRLSGLNDDDHPQYVYLSGRPGGQGSTINGGTLTGDLLDFRANLADADTSYLSLARAAIVAIPDESNPSEEWMLEPGFSRYVFDTSTASVQFSLFGTGERVRAEMSGILGVDVGIRGGQSDSDASSTCLSIASDRWYGDVDCSRTKDPGEEFVDQAGGGGGGNSVEVSIAISGGSGYFSTTVTGQAWVAAGSEILCNPFGTTADGLTPEAVAIAALDAVVSDRVVGTGFTLHVFSPHGIDGTVRFHCVGV